ncbi:MAG: alpha-mannosidase [Planctomycetota bacterium]|jgi:alpha-mannosidase
MNAEQKDFVLLPLDPFYNLEGISLAKRAPFAKLDGMFAMAAEELPEAQPASLLGIPFDLPSRLLERPNCMVPEGQRIEVPADSYHVLFVLGNAMLGNGRVEVALEFEKEGRGERRKEMLRFTDWCHWPQFSEQEAVRPEYRHGDGRRQDGINFIWMQPLFLPPDLNLKGIEFGNCSNMRIYSMTLGRKPYRLPDEAMLSYLLIRLRDRGSEAERFSALYHSLTDLESLIEDGALSPKLEEIRSQALKEITLSDLFAYNEARVSARFEKLMPMLEETHAAAMARFVEEQEEKRSPLRITLAGHSHLDAVWLWPWNDTVQKAYRTFSRNLAKLETYPGANFVQSEPVLYEWMELHYPEVFEEIREMVKAGRWELVGGMWVEPDGNMPCGEALVRQRLFGQRYFLEKFGRLSEVAWIPDTFGMHRNHPQIIRKSGGKYFFTTKLMWNYENDFPFQHFLWESADGSQVLALQAAVGCGMSPGPHESLEESVKKHNVLIEPGKRVEVNYSSPHVAGALKSKETIPEVLAIYGEGDGGEGPSEKSFVRAENLARLPGYEHGSVHDYFRKVEAKYRDRLPVWNDELYLENHRGTTTSQARIKELNRKGEVALLTAEKWAALTEALGLFEAPKHAMDRIWKKLLFNQFHDILPGTSIAQAYVDTELDFDDVFRTARGIRGHALRAIASRISTLPLAGRAADRKFSTGRVLLLFNPLTWARRETVRVSWDFPHVRVQSLDRKEIPCQVIYRDGRHWLLFDIELPPFGYTQVRLLAGNRPALEHGVSIEGRVAETPFYRMELAENGNIARIYDKKLGRELLAGEANDVRFFKNRPKEWSNWNIDPDYAKHEIVPEGPVVIEVLDGGPVVGAFRITRAAPEGGKVVQEIRLYRDSPRIDFITEVDVKYRESLVKAVFPLNSDAEFVKTEIAYGTHDRPAIPKTDFEKAQWEVWTHKWLDVSGTGGGVTFLNSAKYGFDVKGGRIGLTLVKGGIMPDPNTDLFTHRIDYALFPHAGGFEEAHAWKRGYEYNFPVYGMLEEEHDGDLPHSRSFGRVEPENVCWEVLKPAEEGEAMVVRVYEVEGRDVERASLQLPFAVKSAEEVDFLELEVLTPVEVEGDRILFSLGHNEIKAIRVTRS